MRLHDGGIYLYTCLLAYALLAIMELYNTLTSVKSSLANPPISTDWPGFNITVRGDSLFFGKTKFNSFVVK